MLFPHLYGPLPTSAVTAVVPYRPPTPFSLPATGDHFGRALAYYASAPVRRAVGVGDVPGGVAVLDPDHASSHDNNRLILTAPVDADTVDATAEEVGGNAGWPHRAASLMFPGAGDVAAELARRGWNTEELLLMGRPAAPAPGGERADVVDQREVHGFWERSWRRDLPDRPDRERVIADLIGREHLNDRVVAVTDLVVREDGEVVASAQLRVDGATAAVDSVLTDPVARGRGHADAVLARALSLAVAVGCDLVVLEAEAADWPRHWYARRGFEALGSVWWADRRA
jgi:GNAT superfamily N-acetyltransferase